MSPRKWKRQTFKPTLLKLAGCWEKLQVFLVFADFPSQCDGWTKNMQRTWIQSLPPTCLLLSDRSQLKSKSTRKWPDESQPNRRHMKVLNVNLAIIKVTRMKSACHLRTGCGSSWRNPRHRATHPLKRKEHAEYVLQLFHLNRDWSVPTNRVALWLTWSAWLRNF